MENIKIINYIFINIEKKIFNEFFNQILLLNKVKDINFIKINKYIKVITFFFLLLFKINIWLSFLFQYPN